MRYFLLAALLCASACGVKPSFVDPPAGAEDTVFPRTYPADETLKGAE